MDGIKGHVVALGRPSCHGKVLSTCLIIIPDLLLRNVNNLFCANLASIKMLLVKVVNPISARKLKHCNCVRVVMSDEQSPRW